MSSRRLANLVATFAFLLVLIPSSGFAQDELMLIYPRMTHDTIQTTGIAVANPVNQDTYCEFWLVDNNGHRVQAVGTEVPAGAQLALTLKEVFSNAPATFDGYMLVFSESTNISVVGFFLSYTPDVSKIDGAEAIVFQGTAPTDIVFPEIPSGAGAYTEITLLGFTGERADGSPAAPADATIKVIHEENGVVKTAQQKVVKIPAAPEVGIGRYSARLSDIFPGVTLPAKCYVRVSSTRGIFGYEQFGNNNSIAGRNAVQASVGNKIPVALFGAQLAEGYGYTSEITIINPTSLAANVKLAAYRTGVSTQPVVSKLVTIPKNSLIKEKTRVLFPTLPVDFVGWIRVDSDTSGIVGDVSFGDEGSGKKFLSSVQLQASPVTDFVFSQVAEGAGFVTGITFLNPNPDPAWIEVDVYDLDGNWTGNGGFELKGYEHRPRVLSDIVKDSAPGFQQLRGFITVSSDVPIYSFELFLYMPVFPAVESLSAVPPQLGNGTISGKVTPGASTLSTPASMSALLKTRKYPASLAKGVPLDPQKEFIPGEMIVKLRAEASPERINQLSTRLGLRLKHHVQGGVSLLDSAELSVALSYDANDKASPEIAVAKSSTLDMVETLNGDPDVLYAEPNYLFHAHAVPDDDHYHFQWHYPLMNLPAAWDETKGSSSTVVAVIDTGAKFLHTDLGARLNGGQYDFISDQQKALDGNGIDADADDPGDDPTGARSSYHGTHVAGTIGAATDNDNGVAGVNWLCKLMTLRALGLNGSGSLYDISQAILYAAGLPSVATDGTGSKRAHVINMSLGGPSDSFTLRDAVKRAIDRGVIIVASAGNDNVDTPTYPAWYDDVINVGAVDLSGEKAPYSNFGEKITVVAPGGNTAADLNKDGKSDGVLSTAWKKTSSEDAEKYYFYQGTSMAAPHVAGVVSLMLAVKPGMRADEAKAILQSTAIDLGPPGKDNMYGAGLVDAYKAVLEAKGTPSTIPRLAVTTTALDFGDQDTELSVTAFNAGAGRLLGIAFSLSPSGSWLSASPTLTSNGLALTVRVDRTARPKGTYTGKINFTSTNGGTAEVTVTMQVGGAGAADIGEIYVLALDPMTLENMGQASATFEEGYVFQMPPTAVGSYIVVAGNDKNGDFMLGGTGEYFALYPVSSQPSLVYVYPNEDTPGIEFVLDNPQAQAGAALLDEWKQKTGLEGIPVRRTIDTLRIFDLPILYVLP